MAMNPSQGAGRAFTLPGGVYNATPGQIVFGSGAFGRMAEIVERLGGTRAVVVSTPGRGALAERAAELLGTCCAGLIPEAISQVPIELARRGRTLARDLGADCIVSVGGGASVGLGKAIALEMPVPVVAVPTTYSGSEMTGFCGITIDGVKRMHTSLAMLASAVIYDPDLSRRLPLDVSMASAMNALAHCMDVVYVATASPMSKAAGFEGAGVIVDAMARVAASPDDPDARSDLLYGAYLGGAALTGGFALQHGVAHVLGGSFGVPHGLSHALVLPHVAAYNARFAPAEFNRLAREVGGESFAGASFDLLGRTGLPSSLRELGFDEANLDAAARITVETDHGLNPGPVTLDGVRALLDDAFHGRRPA